MRVRTEARPGTTRLIRHALLQAAAVLTAAGLAAAFAPAFGKERPLVFHNAQIEPVSWTALDGWKTDDLASAYAAFRTSCGAILRADRKARQTRVMLDGLYHACAHAKAATLDAAGARKFFETNFRPVRIAALGDNQGFLTGYYEGVFAGSRVRTDEYTVPIYRAPVNLVVAGASRVANFPSSGAKVGRLVGKRKIVPFYDRAAIEEGVLAGRGLEICWVKDPVDAFFAQIQGSARVRLTTGELLRINYDAHNGHPYFPVGRDLIDRGIIPKEEMSMDRIRAWMTANPEEATALRRKNRSFVFFRETGLGEHDEPIGAQGVPLATGRSIAVDKKLHVYGTPFWIEAELPIDSEKPETPFRRLMIAQDTGSAILGPARADIYFGAGEDVGSIAGRIKQNGRFVMLVPRALDPVANAHMPLPRTRPQRLPVATNAPARDKS
ncbi:MAG TPA: MltA domain-containing protein [Pseudolabrys sp.]|nr:MltA domain-containing protein [Pseudolabrys sp.]